MREKKILFLAFLIVLILASSGMSQEKHEHAGGKPEKLGTVHFPVSCGDETQMQFDRAVALLHSFWYSEANKAFADIAKKEPNCAMAYWGIAMTLYHPLWESPDSTSLRNGWAAILKAKAAGSPTDGERDYIAAIEVFYKDSDKLDHRARALTYEKAMERLYQKYPEDREAAIFYALALNGTALPTDKTFANQKKAGAILEKVFSEQLDHPGVAHYIIHSYDYPPLASQALTAARRYAKIAPSSPHALHMPSHIFTRLGLWQESIESNIASASAAKANHLVGDQLHAMDYMVYAYLQGAQDREANRILEERNAILKYNPGSMAGSYAVVAIPARYAIERGQWSDAALLEVGEGNPAMNAITYFARGIGAARSGDTLSARRNIEKLDKIHDALIQTKNNYLGIQVAIQRRAVAAWLAHGEGKDDEALALMRSSAELESSTEKHPVTPGPIIPSRELVGDLLLELHQPGQALQEFETSLLASPNRFHGLYGAAKAAELSGDKEKATSYYTKLVEICSHADSDRPELREARASQTKK